MSEIAPSELPAIIVIEDDLGIQMILRRIVNAVARGYDIVTVASGVAAFEQLMQRPVPLVFTDYNLPGMNGLQIAQRIRQESPDTKIVLVTAYATPELERQARAIPIDFFLSKPFKIDRIEEIIKETLGT